MTSPNNITECNADSPACQFDQNLEHLRGLRVFSSLPLEAVRAYAFLCERVRYQQGELVFAQDAADNKAYILLSGSLELVRQNDEGEEQIYSQYSEGDFIGGMALLSDVRRIFSLRVATPSVCLVLPRKKILTDLVSNPEVANMFISAIAERIVKWEERTLLHAESKNCKLPDVGISLI